MYAGSFNFLKLALRESRRDYNRAPEDSMTIHRFQLRGEFIPLNDLLKLLGLAPSGGAAKALIAEGAVVVDREIETRIRRKLRPGTVVRFADEEIRIVAADPAN